MPSWRKSRAFLPISSVGYEDGETTISWARITTSTACSNDSTSKVPSARRNFMRLRDARLHAESSTCMYSEQGLDALIRPEFGHVCQLLIVVSYCTPGSAQRHAASAT